MEVAESLLPVTLMDSGINSKIRWVEMSPEGRVKVGSFIRYAKGHCGYCGYDLRLVEELACPGCGSC